MLVFYLILFESPISRTTYIAGHLPVVPIHAFGTFALADDGGGVPVEPGRVRSEAQLIFRTLEDVLVTISSFSSLTVEFMCFPSSIICKIIHI